jgi:hypothetical protein
MGAQRVTARSQLAASAYGPGRVYYGSPNLISKTQDFSNAVWAIGGGTVTVTADQAVAPDGTTTADRVHAAGGAIREQSIVVLPLTLYTFSVFLMAVSGTQNVPLMIYDDHAVAVLATATVTPSASIWTRYSISGLFPAGSDFAECGFNVATYDVYAWGAQFQKGPLGPYRPVA